MLRKPKILKFCVSIHKGTVNHGLKIYISLIFKLNLKVFSIFNAIYEMYSSSISLQLRFSQRMEFKIQKSIKIA